MSDNPNVQSINEYEEKDPFRALYGVIKHLMIDYEERRFRDAFDWMFFNNDESNEAHNRVTFSLHRLEEALGSREETAERFYKYMDQLQPDHPEVEHIRYSDLEEPVE